MPVVVLRHGLGCSTETWNRLVGVGGGDRFCQALTCMSPETGVAVGVYSFLKLALNVGLLSGL